VQPEAPEGTLQEVVWDLPRSYVVPSCGDSWPRGKTTTHRTRELCRMGQQWRHVIPHG